MRKGDMNVSVDEFCAMIDRYCRLVNRDKDDVQNERFSLLAAHNENGERIDYKRLSELEDESFVHDVGCIDAFASRDTEDPGLLKCCFVPRCGFVKEN